MAWAAARPLFAAPGRAAESQPVVKADRWRKQRDEAIAGIKEAEFDFHVGKLSETDYRELRGKLEARAALAMRALERESE